MKKDIQELYSDEHIVVVNKPAPLLSIPDRFDQSLANLRDLLRKRYGSAYVVHRLDRETSGVVLAALTPEAQSVLQDQFSARTVEKEYTALLEGVPHFEDDPLVVDIPIEVDPRQPGLMRASVAGKASRTDFSIVEQFKNAFLVKCVLHTGRQHQIRVHAKAIGHPLFIDSQYGNREEFFVSSVKRRFNVAKNEDERPLMNRQTLHASKLTFDHPVTGERLSFEAPLQKDFKAICQVLRKYASTVQTDRSFGKHGGQW